MAAEGALGAVFADRDQLGRAGRDVADEDVGVDAAFAGQRRVRGERDVVAVGGDRRFGGLVFARFAHRAGRSRDESRRRSRDVADEDVFGEVFEVDVVGPQRRARGEGDVAAIGGDRRFGREFARRAFRAARPRDEFGGAAVEVADEDVLARGGQAGGEIVGRGDECDLAAVGGDRRFVRAAVGDGTARLGGAGNEGRRLREEVADVDLRFPARLGGEVPGEGGEGDVAPVGGDRRGVGVVFGDRAGCAVGARGQRHLARLNVLDVDLQLPRFAPCHQVPGARSEGDVAPVGGDRGIDRVAIPTFALEVGPGDENRVVPAAPVRRRPLHRGSPCEQ